MFKLPWKRDSPKFKHWLRDVFALMLYIREIIRLSGKCESTGRVLSVVSFQTKLCALFVRLFFVYGKKRGIRESDMEKKKSGMRDFLKKGAFVWDQDPHPLADRDWSKILG